MVHKRLEASGFLSFKIFKRRLEASRVGLPPRGTPRRRAPRCKAKSRALLAVVAVTASRGERWVLLSCEGLNLLVKNKKLEKAFGAVWSPGFLILRKRRGVSSPLVS